MLIAAEVPPTTSLQLLLNFSFKGSEEEEENLLLGYYSGFPSKQVSLKFLTTTHTQSPQKTNATLIGLKTPNGESGLDVKLPNDQK